MNAELSEKLVNLKWGMVGLAIGIGALFICLHVLSQKVETQRVYIDTLREMIIKTTTTKGERQP
jgi:hypothetical protein